MYSQRAGQNAGVRGTHGDDGIAQSRTAALRIYALADNPKVTAKAVLESASTEPKRARRDLLVSLHHGTLGNASPEDVKLFGLAATVVTTAFTAVTSPSKAADSAFADACRFARDESAWAKKFVADNVVVAPPVPAVVQPRGVLRSGDIYEPSMVIPKQNMPVVVSDPKVQAMHAGIRAALDAYAEIMALGEPERPRISIYV